jgi:hypothetical protein
VLAAYPRAWRSRIHASTTQGSISRLGS